MIEVDQLSILSTFQLFNPYAQKLHYNRLEKPDSAEIIFPDQCHGFVNWLGLLPDSFGICKA